MDDAWPQAGISAAPRKNGIYYRIFSIQTFLIYAHVHSLNLGSAPEHRLLRRLHQLFFLRRGTSTSCAGDGTTRNASSTTTTTTSS
jgi:hypothetical protein